MSLLFSYTSIISIILIIPFIVDLKTIWFSFYFAAIFLILIQNMKFNGNKISQKKQSLIAFIVIAFPFIASILSFIESGVLNNGILSGIIVMDVSLMFLQYFITLPFSMINSSKIIESNFKPLLTVIVPAFNEEKWIKRTLESLIETDYINKEIIVVDDGSTDNTYLIAYNFMRDHNQIQVYTKKNGGKASAINYGLLMSKGEFVVIIDADGLISRNSLSEISSYFQDPSVIGVAGNVRVLNQNNILTKCQAIEYSVGINLQRAATASFGAVEVLPGPLSAFRRTSAEKVGRFDSDTIVEDSDFTKKLLTTGSLLQCSTDSYAYTEVPDNLRDFVKQRTRWYRGNIQTFLKHRDFRNFSSNTIFSTIFLPLSFLQIFIQPIFGVIATISLVYTVLSGNFIGISRLFSVFFILQFLITFIAIKKGGENTDLVFYSPFLLIGYKHLIDFIKVKCIFQHITNTEIKWNKVERKGPNY